MRSYRNTLTVGQNVRLVGAHPYEGSTGNCTHMQPLFADRTMVPVVTLDKPKGKTVFVLNDNYWTPA